MMTRRTCDFVILVILLEAATSAGMSTQIACPPCQCDLNHVANCTALRLTAIPSSVPSNTTTLILRDNKFEEIMNDQFTRFRNLTKLDISYNHLSYFHPEAFSSLNAITVMDVSHNEKLKMYGIENITRSLENSSIEALYMNKVVSSLAVCVIFFDSVMNSLRNTPLAELYADQNRIEVFGEKTLSMFPKKLKKLFLRGSRFTIGPYIQYISSLTELEEVDLSVTVGATVERPGEQTTKAVLGELLRCVETESCQAIHTDLRVPVLWPETVDTELEHQVLQMLTFDPPPKLKTFKMTFSQLYFPIPKMKFGNNSLRRIDLSSNIISTWHGPLYGLEELNYLDLSNNIARNVSKHFFQGFTGLEYLYISKNFIGLNVATDLDGELFSSLRRLKVLDISNNFIPFIRNSTFKNLISLHALNLSSNNIHALNLDIQNMNGIHTILCNTNHIRWLPKVLIHQLDNLSKKHSITMDLSQNPIACTCNNLHFIHWLSSTDVKLGNMSDYYCIYTDGTIRTFRDLPDVDDIYQDLYTKCSNHFAMAIGMVALFMFMFSVILAGIAYRYRWKLRYWYYAAKLHYVNIPGLESDKSFEFNAFVSFADEDSSFVLEYLVPKVENETGFRLLLHMRDFKPGCSIAQNIVNAVKTSRWTLVVLSEDFLASSWCRYELQMANMERVTTERDVILIVMYRRVISKDIPPEICYHIQNNSFIDYPQEGSRDVFWKSLLETLKS